MYVVSVEDTKNYGIVSAAIIGRIKWWCEYNKTKKVKDRYYQDYWWSGFMSSKELSEQLGISKKTIENHLSKLLKNGIIIKGVFNKKNYDRTSWYRVNPFPQIKERVSPNQVIPFTQIKEMDLPKSRKPIPVNLSVNQNVKQTVSHSVNPSVEELEAEERGRKILEEFKLKKELETINK